MTTISNPFSRERFVQEIYRAIFESDLKENYPVTFSRPEERTHLFNLHYVGNDLAAYCQVDIDAIGQWRVRFWRVVPGKDTDLTNLALDAVRATREPDHQTINLDDREWNLLGHLIDTDYAHDYMVRVTRRLLYGLINYEKSLLKSRLEQRIPGLTIDRMGGVVPVESVGRWHGFPFYFRYRGAWANLGLNFPNDADDILNPRWSAGMEYGEQYQGELSIGELEQVFLALARNLKPVPVKETQEPVVYPDPAPDFRVLDELVGV